MISTILEFAKQMDAVLGQVSQSIAQTIATMDGMAGAVSKAMENAERVMHKAYKGFLEVARMGQRFSFIMVELGWPPHASLTPREMRQIVDVYDQHGPAEAGRIVNEYMLTRYDSELIEDMYQRWEDSRWLRTRLPILRQAIDAHLDGKYFVSVPSLLPQIEGIIAEGHAHRGRLMGPVLREYSEKLLSDRGFFSFDEAIWQFLDEVVLARFEHGVGSYPTFSRHAILHGADTEYGTATNSLKCILLFDYVQAKFRVASVGNGKAYHANWCPVVQKHRMHRAKPMITTYSSTQAAEKAGKVACKLCKPQ